MNKTALKNFATNARKELIEKVKAKAFKIGITEENIKKAQLESSDAIYIDGKQLTATEKKQREKLISRIREIGYQQVVEEVAYTYFNRFTALRFMEVNNYLPTKVRVLSSSNSDSSEPDIVKEALTVDLNIDKELVYELKINNKTDELFKYLVIKQCNSLNKVLPFMFEKIDDYKEILFPDSLLAKDSFLREMTDTQVIPETDWEQVEIIGWLYQYYITEKKDQIFADFKKNIKINKENMPAATQLFTPDWIVKYMIENSLGKIWLESNPESSLKSKWKYLLDEAQHEEVVMKKLEEIRYKNVNPEEILLIDPCCGSGHILVYAFDVLYEMYLEKGYVESEIPKKILENNIYGIDIDDRAVQLASFAIMMKARSKYRRVFTQGIQLNILSIQESNWMTDEIVKNLSEDDYLIKEMLTKIRDCFWDAKEYGSLLQLEPMRFELLEERVIKYTGSYDNLLDMVEKKVVEEKLPILLRQSKVLSQKYDVLCTNPPYMGSSNMNDSLKKFVSKEYDKGKADICVAFIESGLTHVKSNGYCSLVTMHSWFFLSSFESFRKDLLEKSTIKSILHLGMEAFEGIIGKVVQTAAFVLQNKNIQDYKPHAVKLVDYYDGRKYEKEAQFFNERNRYKSIKQREFNNIPGSPIAYWISERFNEVFCEGEQLSQIGDAKSGLQTGDNNYFLKYWHEVNINNIGFNNKSLDEAIESGYKWFPQVKGGSYRKWYGNYDYVVNFQNGGYEIKNFEGHGIIKSPHLYFKEGITWSHTTNVSFGSRILPSGFIFNVEAPTIFNVEDQYLLLGLLNTKITDYILSIINDTIHYLVGDMKKIPVIYPKDKETKELVRSIVLNNISLCKNDWDYFEISWDFKKHPLLIHKSGTINDSLNIWETTANQQFEELKKNEQKLNEVFIQAYGLQDEMTPDVLEESISIRRVIKEREVKSFLSYAVGCIFGRYSLDEDGLIFAGGKFNHDKYKLFPADKDGILPILSGRFLEEDIIDRIIELINVTFGESCLTENLEFIAMMIGKKDNETPIETITRYFLNDFYKDHVQVYKRKPIYWLFTSGKQKAFNSLIYIHRYEKSTLSRIRTDYLHVLQLRMDVERKSLFDIIEGDGMVQEIRNAKKELKSLELKIEELRAYDEKLHHMADMQIEIDLDDGVTANYAKFEGLVAPIK